MSETTPKKTEPQAMTLTLAEKTHREIDTIEADLMKARARFVELEPQNRDYFAKRTRAVERRLRLEAKHKQENPDHPFDPEMYTPAAHVPKAEWEHGREFHKLHYTIAALEKELNEAKNALVNA